MKKQVYRIKLSENSDITLPSLDVKDFDKLMSDPFVAWMGPKVIGTMRENFLRAVQVGDFELIDADKVDE